MNRIGMIAIMIEEHRESVEQVNHILSEFSDCIHARMGVPNHEKDLFIIALVVEVTTQQLGALTGRLGKLKGVTVKSMMTNKTY
jgi:putative iron-only hydrogenase system regulator